jgi:hypothetical protein
VFKGLKALSSRQKMDFKNHQNISVDSIFASDDKNSKRNGLI